MRARRRCSRSKRLLVCLGTAVVLLNVCCGYALLSLHGSIHAPADPPVAAAARKAATAAADVDEEDVLVGAERDEWDVVEDSLAAAESATSLPGDPEHGAMIEGDTDVTLVTQTSPERLWMVEPLSQRWGGAISLALYLPGRGEKKLLQPFRKWHAGAEGGARVALSELRGKASEAYPINRLRNLALLKVVTSHLLLTDIDLWPSTTAYAALRRTPLLRRARAALVLPAFEFHEDKAKPRSKDSRSNLDLAQSLPGTRHFLRKCIQRGQEPNCQVFKHATDTHLTTNYDHWWRSSVPVRVPCFQSLRYEPYIVVPKENAPPFDERFVGYGKNKIQWIQHLRLLGFTFHVMPKIFVIHCPHEDSTARRTWEAFRNKKDRLFHDFVTAQAQNATINTRMCKHGVNWDVMHPGVKGATLTGSKGADGGESDADPEAPEALEEAQEAQEEAPAAAEGLEAPEALEAAAAKGAETPGSQTPKVDRSAGVGDP